MDIGTLFLIFAGFIAALVFLSLTATAVFRPDKLETLIEAYKVLGLALIGKRRSDKNNHPPAPPCDPPLT